MNRAAAILLTLTFSASAFAAERPKAFAGVPWGAAVPEALRILATRPDVTVPAPSGEESDAAVSQARKIEATGGKFADVDVATWMLEFAGGKFNKGTVTFKTSGDARTHYRTFRQKLMDKYGGVARETKNNTTWVLPPDLWDKHARTIKLDIIVESDASTRLTLTYIDDTLVAEAQPKPPRPAEPTLITPKGGNTPGVPPKRNIKDF